MRNKIPIILNTRINNSAKLLILKSIKSISRITLNLLISQTIITHLKFNSIVVRLKFCHASDSSKFNHFSVDPAKFNLLNFSPKEITLLYNPLTWASTISNQSPNFRSLQSKISIFPITKLKLLNVFAKAITFYWKS